ncbi:MAG: hypothetical protein DRR08_21300 [Candidatus Parabeggiatoa sp. nov. 2]|nr:MAG: hypothetical protein B6247_16925 [Beggiatoa sp. 4572_84]RKZ56607.1 MAG: hypothetical protein DRR08_21300 [Gammaproteobacteria bacterium]HEC86189.1 hypothetical protein [Thioploca sp.]
MNTQQPLDIQAYLQATVLKRIGNRAVRKALEENRRLGIPNVYSHNGELYYELPNGKITQKDPFNNRDMPRVE